MTSSHKLHVTWACQEVVWCTPLVESTDPLSSKKKHCYTDTSGCYWSFPFASSHRIFPFLLTARRILITIRGSFPTKDRKLWSQSLWPLHSAHSFQVLAYPHSYPLYLSEATLSYLPLPLPCCPWLDSSAPSPLLFQHGSRRLSCPTMSDVIELYF